MAKQRENAVIKKYEHESIRARLEAFFLDNLGKVATRAQIQKVAKDPKTGKEPENWHQRLSELRTDHGYSILTNRDSQELKLGEYMLVTAEKRAGVGKRVACSQVAWKQVLERAHNACEWNECGEKCGLEEGTVDPVGGGTVKLTADHMNPHSLHSAADADNPEEWQALCGRHQVMKKHYWDSSTGKLNIYAIVQSASLTDKKRIFQFLEEFFGETK